MKTAWPLIAWLSFFLVGQSLGARILAFLPFPAKSHQAVFTPLLRELGNRGHQVTAYIPYPLSNPPPGYKEILVEDLLSELHGSVDLLEFSKMGAIEQEIALREVGMFFQEKVCSSQKVQNLLKSNEQFDAVIMESLFVQETFSALPHRFNAIPIEILPLGNAHWVFDVVGNPYNPSYNIDFKVPFTDKMTFFERVQNTIVSLATSLLGYLIYMPKTQKLMDKCFKYPGSTNRPGVVQLLSNKSLVLLNSHLSLNYPYAMSPHVIEVGGLHITPSKPLPKDLQTFMDEAKEGVVYFSLGSNINVSSVAQGKVFDAFSSAFKRLKQKVLWKWEKDDFKGKSANVKTAKWFPQQDILAHKNCKLFITHGGYLSVSEAVKFGVPMMGIPFFGDQQKNMRQVTAMGYGVQLDLDDISEEEVYQKITHVLNTPTFAKAAKERSVLFNDKPMTALESAAHWTEYVIRHKGAHHLRPALTSMPWYQALMIDVIAVFAGVVFTVVTLLYLMVSKFLRFICCRTKKETAKKGKQKTN